MTGEIEINTFNLKVVVQETGLKPETLRAWERRYGLPTPQRSEGGHRLYSRRDIEIVKWLINRQEEGLSISNAVEMWNTLNQNGQDPLDNQVFTPSEPSLYKNTDMSNLREAWIEACLAYNEKEAEGILTQAFALYPLEAVSIELLGNGLAEIGNGWYRGNISVQQEHFASGLAMRKIETLIAAAPQPTRLGRIMIAAPPEENHEFVLLLLNLLLRRRGWDVLYLGADTPLIRLEGAIEQSKPKLVVSSAQQLHTAANLLEMALTLIEAGIPLAYGGRVFNGYEALRKHIPGHYLGRQIEMVPETVERILFSTNSHVNAISAPENYQQAKFHFMQKLPLIENLLWENLSGQMSYRHLTIANMNMARDIAAALTLGDMAFLGNEIQWAEGLLSNFNLPKELIDNYMHAYYLSAVRVLEDPGMPVLTWLEQFNLEMIDQLTISYGKVEQEIQ